MLAVSHLSFSYQNNAILSDLSFQLQPGTCTVVVGPNGCGKSTLLSILSGVLRPKQGAIHADGSIGLVPQGNGIFEDMTVAENLRFFCNLAHRPIPSPLPFGLAPYAGTRASRLSGGYQKRLGIACTYVANPDYWLFDEPCAGLDILWRQELSQLIVDLKSQGHGILYVGHDPGEFTAFYDNLLILDRSHSTLISRKNIPVGTEACLIRRFLLSGRNQLEKEL